MLLKIPLWKCQGDLLRLVHDVIDKIDNNIMQFHNLFIKISL